MKMNAVILQSSVGALVVNQPPNQGSTVFLYIVGISVGIGLLLTAVVVLLLGIGIIKQVPVYVIWAIVLFAIGVGILSGISMRQ